MTYCVRCANDQTDEELAACACPKDGLVESSTGPWIFPENPCYQCGHERTEHDADGCMNGGKFGPMGAYEPGPDACECVRFLEPQS